MADTIRDGARPILIFPGGMPRSLDYLRQCQRDGIPAIGASSLNYDVARAHYASWRHLPYVNRPDFDDALREILREFDIGGIYSPNPLVWNHLRAVLGSLAPGVRLVNDSPVDDALTSYRAALARAHDLLERPLPLASALPGKAPISEVDLAALFRHTDTIPGMCDHEKACALHEIARHAAVGDLVEVGSWWGKSAFVLMRLARCYGIGNLLCVDPWSSEHLIQHDASGIVDGGSASLDADEALTVFEMNLLPYSAGNVNYLRLPSIDGARYYVGHRGVATPAFGATSYEGRIAILHIDGNHAYASVRADIEAWSGLVAGGGWIVLDDYTWPFGDGPRRAGDEFLASYRARIECAFVMGGALFVQLS